MMSVCIDDVFMEVIPESLQNTKYMINLKFNI